MKALILAAGVGDRLGGGQGHSPKCLLRFDGRSLLERHLENLAACGVEEVVIGVGYRAQDIERELEGLRPSLPVRVVRNPDYREGNVVTLWCLLEDLTHGGDVLLMDADVLYDARIMTRLVASPHADCFLLDRDFEPGDEPVKLCVREGRIVEFRKHVAAGTRYDYHGESVGFFRLSPGMAAALANAVAGYVERGERDEFYEEALRDVVLGPAGGAFRVEDISGLPWIEIDFPEDVARAEREILPRLQRPPSG